MKTAAYQRLGSAAAVPAEVTPTLPVAPERGPPRPLPPVPRPEIVPPAPPVAAPAPEVVGPHANDSHQPGMLPHPMDEARERIHTENRLIQRLNDAMSFRQVKEMRELLAQYRTLDPMDLDASQAGYSAIADCIESPGEASLLAAHQFYDKQRHSPLRRWVRRICIEKSH